MQLRTEERDAVEGRLEGFGRPEEVGGEVDGRSEPGEAAATFPTSSQLERRFPLRSSSWRRGATDSRSSLVPWIGRDTGGTFSRR